MGILKIPIEIIDAKIYANMLEEYNESMNDYYHEKESEQEDELAKLIGKNKTFKKPVFPDPPMKEANLTIKEEMILGYEEVGNKIYLLVDNIRLGVSEPKDYITNRSDKIIQNLDRILENN